MVKTVFLDLDDTILDFHQAEKQALSRTLRQFDIDPTPAVLDRYHVINRRQWELLEERKITRPQVLTRRFDLLFQELGAAVFSEEVCAVYEVFLSQGHFFMPIPGFDPAACVMVGDSLTSDIRGARDAGLRTCWYNPQGQPPRPDILPDYTVRDLGEVPALLASL